MLEGRQLHEKSFHFMFFPSQFTAAQEPRSNAIISNPGNSSSIHKVIDIRSKTPMAGKKILPKLPSPTMNFVLLQRFLTQRARKF